MNRLLAKGGGFASPFFCLALGLSGCQNAQSDQTKDLSSHALVDSLNGLSIEALRVRKYNSDIKVEALTTDNCIGGAPRESLPNANASYKSYMASFSSDGLRQYARLTVPDTPAPKSGHPFVLFLHGYVGIEKAPNYSIGCNPDNLYYSELTDAFARAGFAVLSPGYRGHGTVNGVPAEGLEYLDAFDQGAGVSTHFYAIDSLNFTAGLSNIDGSAFPKRGFEFDMEQYFLLGHSQGGDAGLTFLAAVGEGENDHLSPKRAALWSGTFLPRLRALEEMMPVTMTPEAFLSGDGTWTGTAIGKDGSHNPNFIFGYPPDWIESPYKKDWTWQNDTWSEASVRSAVSTVSNKMYQDLRKHVVELNDIEVTNPGELNDLNVIHDPKVEALFAQIGGYTKPEFLSEVIELHVPDKDYYSQLSWNQNLCARIEAAGGDCRLVRYADNNHSLRASAHEWFSPLGTPDGFPVMIDNLVKAFTGDLNSQD